MVRYLVYTIQHTHSIQRINGQLLSSYRFRHIIFQKFLYSSLDEVERVRLHELVGTTLEALYATQGDIVPISPQRESRDAPPSADIPQTPALLSSTAYTPERDRSGTPPRPAGWT